jgi:hypothetical protein
VKRDYQNEANGKTVGDNLGDNRNFGSPKKWIIQHPGTFGKARFGQPSVVQIRSTTGRNFGANRSLPRLCDAEL